MNAYTNREELSLLSATRIHHPEHHADRYTRPSLFARIAAYFRRQATLTKLNRLTDRELADIGLSRGALHLAFEPSATR